MEHESLTDCLTAEVEYQLDEHLTDENRHLAREVAEALVENDEFWSKFNELVIDTFESLK